MGLRILFYRTPSGASPVEAYFDRLSGRPAAEVADALVTLSREGLRAVDTRQIERRLWEIRTPSQRVFYVLLTGEQIVLLHAYRKQGQKAPQREVDLARRRAEEVLKWQARSNPQ